MTNNISIDLIKIINSYYTKPIYVVLRHYYQNNNDRGADYFGTFTSYDKAMITIHKEINDDYLKYGEHKYDTIETYTVNWYESYDHIKRRKINPLGTTEYTFITTTKFQQTSYPNYETHYKYEIQTQELDIKAPTGVA